MAYYINTTWFFPHRILEVIVPEWYGVSKVVLILLMQLDNVLACFMKNEFEMGEISPNNSVSFNV